MNVLKPSHFKAQPWNSLYGKLEAEIIARNIMVIRARRGDIWPLSWEQYREERQKDGNFSELEKGYFDEVIALIPDAIGAVRFSPTWTKAAREVQLSEAVDA